MFWFLTLAGVLIFQAIVIFAVITDTPVNISFLWLSYNLSAEDIQSISSNLQKNWFFLKLSAVLGLILVPALGYAFANKNYRIYSNLLEQYRHRATVAATLEGILEQIKQDEANKDIRDILTATAAHAMFEHKAIGHLSKKENEASALSETLAIIGTRK
ncbi:MAG TPA: hypothetical protein VI336_01045 [Candidatus Saccharimonadales bacterium]|nr:hypothetical protein [Candidatus Saccharimonadales bacterium]